MNAQHRRVQVLPYDPNWKYLFEEEAALLSAIFQSNSLNAQIKHIGSTSVPGLVAKAIIDILPVVQDIGFLGPAQRTPPGDLPDDTIASALQKIGFEQMGEYGLPGRRYFRKLDGLRHLVHLHCYQIGNPEITRHLAFRDYLRAHPDVARQYADVKLSLAKKYPDSPANYQDGKDIYVQELEKLALQWQSTNQMG